MKNYKSLASPPHTDYTKFTGGLGGQAGLPEPTDNTAIKRLENHERLQKRGINRNSHDNSKLGNYYYPYTSEDIINGNGSRDGTNRLLENEEEERHPIVLPFYIPIIDIIISNDLSIDIVDHSIRVGVDTKESILCSGKIRKYRVLGDVKECNFIIEMDNNTVYHVKKKGIMMRTSVHDELRRHIIKIMVNFIGGGGGGGGGTSGNDTVIVKPKKKWFHKFACFSSTPE